jgi:hypothetical protein
MRPTTTGQFRQCFQMHVACTQNFGFLFLAALRCRASAGTTVLRVLCMAARWGSSVLCRMPNRNDCILLVSVMRGREGNTAQGGRQQVCHTGTTCPILHAK